MGEPLDMLRRLLRHTSALPAALIALAVAMETVEGFGKAAVLLSWIVAGYFTGVAAAAGAIKERLEEKRDG